MPGNASSMSAHEAERIAFDACLAGYPLVMLDAARDTHPAGPNRFVHGRTHGDEILGLGAPNPHVVYSSA